MFFITRPARVVATAWLTCSAAAHAATSDAPVFVTPSTPYLSRADIPTGFYAGGTPTLLDTLESGSLHASLSAPGGVLLNDGFAGARDSVDADDGVIDGTCGPQVPGRCTSYFTTLGTLTFTYAGTGPLPTAFGLVWTDGAGTITFSAVGANGQSLGSVTRSGFADNSFLANTGEDRFFGVQFAGGIRSITISNTNSGLEVDHIQYGSMGTLAPVPEPGTWALMVAGLGLLATRRRARRCAEASLATPPSFPCLCLAS